ncbi:hypothetical protein [Taibaiella soli]|uniref:Uncharacterized protein n=1 Tax=Taibaiella soli TaxID=1649169 RepID=A0A2W2BDP4_9BACT|nr:hypothetical protein [Taibaiella soli]PZF74379.1 hypothetical protein DN068_02020 [Taibaiella soli]
MPLNDLLQTPIDETSLAELKQLTDKLVAALQAAGVVSHLTPAERRQYGSINEQNKLLVNKVHDYNVANASYSSPDVNWDLFEKNLIARNGLKAIENGLTQLLEICSDTRILYDYSLYHNALVDYDYTKYKATSVAGGAGYTTKYQDIKQLFGVPSQKADSSTDANDTATTK